MKWILFIILFQIPLSYSGNLIKGEGKFTSVAGDSHEFIKKQLVFEGIKDIISKELEVLNLNKELFWQKYDEDLNKRLEDIETSYKTIKKFEEETNQKRKNRIIENIRIKKLKYRRTFLSLNKLLSKFSIKKMSRSQKNPRFRYIRIEGVIRSNKLTKIYYNLVRGKQVSEYGSLYLRPSFNLSGTTYSELGVENEKDLEGEVSKNWLEWLIKNKPLNIANVEILEDEKEESFINLMKLPVVDYAQNIPEYFVNSLVLELEVNVVKEKFDPRLKESFYIYSGFAYLKDIQTNLTIGTFKFNKTEKTYRFSPKVNIANVIANHVYQMAKSSFPAIRRSIKNMSPISKMKKLQFEKYESINQVHDFLSLVESRGVKFSLKTKMNSFTQDQAAAILYYDGELNDLKQLFLQLQSAKKDLSFEVIDVDEQLGIKFNKVIENI